jgi:hypothetical protein
VKELKERYDRLEAKIEELIKSSTADYKRVRR